MRFDTWLVLIVRLVAMRAVQPRFMPKVIMGSEEARVFAICFRPIVDNGDVLTGRSCDVRCGGIRDLCVVAVM